MPPALHVRRCILCQKPHCFLAMKVNLAVCRVVLTVMVNFFAWLPSETALGEAIKPLLTQVYMQVGLCPPFLSRHCVSDSAARMLPC